MKAVGARLPRYDGVAHVTGRTKFVDDVRVPGMLWAKALRSPVHHAGIKRLDTIEGRGDEGRPRRDHARGRPAARLRAPRRRSASPADEPLLAKDEVRYKGQPIAVVAAEDEETAQAAVEAIEIDFDGAPALFDVRKAADPDAPQIHHWGNWYPHFEGEMDRRQIRKGDIDAAFEQADMIVQGVYRPGRDRALPARDAGLPRRARAERPPDDLLVHAGAVLLDGRRRRAPRGAAEQAQVRRRHGRRRLRRQGRHGDRDDLRAARAEVRPAGEVALDARGGVPLLVHPRALAHGDRGRRDERRLDPRPQDADAPRLGRVRALLAVRR